MPLVLFWSTWIYWICIDLRDIQNWFEFEIFKTNKKRMMYNYYCVQKRTHNKFKRQILKSLVFSIFVGHGHKLPVWITREKSKNRKPKRKTCSADWSLYTLPLSHWMPTKIGVSEKKLSTLRLWSQHELHTEHIFSLEFFTFPISRITHTRHLLEIINATDRGVWIWIGYEFNFILNQLQNRFCVVIPS